MTTRYILSAVLILVLLGCASTASVHSEFDETADFDNYSTFVLCIDDLFVENTDYPNYDNNFVRELVGNEIERQMLARDHETNVLQPELQAGFELIVTEKEATFKNCETEGDYDYWHECTMDTIVYTEETLVLYVLDFQMNQVIWQAALACDMNRSKAKLPEYIAALVERLFNDYPKVPNTAL